MVALQEKIASSPLTPSSKKEIRYPQYRDSPPKKFEIFPTPGNKMQKTFLTSTKKVGVWESIYQIEVQTTIKLSG